MTALTKLPVQKPQQVDVYLGFEILQHGEDSYVAIPRGWTHVDAKILEAEDLPALRKRIWSWWHRLLD
jgi:hypothetical protein